MYVCVLCACLLLGWMLNPLELKVQGIVNLHPLKELEMLLSTEPLVLAVFCQLHTS